MNKGKWTVEEEYALRFLNEQGNNYVEISKLINRSPHACRTRGQKMGLDGMNNNANINYFNEDSREMYYILGYWYADGGIYQKQGGTYFDISSIDKEQIVKIRDAMEIKTSILEDKTNENTSYRVMVGNKKLVENLVERFDVPYRKTDKITINKDKIPEKYFYDFLRGYFDGDGSLLFSSHVKTNGKTTLTGAKFTGSKKIIHSLYDILTSENYRCSLIEDGRSEKNNCWYLEIYGDSGRRLLSNIYENPIMFLERKYKAYLDADIPA